MARSRITLNKKKKVRGSLIQMAIKNHTDEFCKMSIWAGGPVGEEKGRISASLEDTQSSS